jgi:predicted RNase H-like nuclease (RuvC/YqgF family)
LRDRFAQAISKQLSGNFSTISSFGGQHDANRLFAVQKKLKAKESENKLLSTSNDDLLQKLQDADERIRKNRNLERELESERADLKNSRFDHRTLYSNYLDLNKNYKNIYKDYHDLQSENHALRKNSNTAVKLCSTVNRLRSQAIPSHPAISVSDPDLEDSLLSFTTSILPRFVPPWAPADPRIAEQEAKIDELSSANQEYAQDARRLHTYLEHQQQANAALHRALARVPRIEATDEEYSPA